MVAPLALGRRFHLAHGHFAGEADFYYLGGYLKFVVVLLLVQLEYLLVGILKPDARLQALYKAHHVLALELLANVERGNVV